MVLREDFVKRLFPIGLIFDLEEFLASKEKYQSNKNVENFADMKVKYGWVYTGLRSMWMCHRITEKDLHDYVTVLQEGL